MPLSDLCAPLDHCQDLDGRLLLRRAFYGPQLVFDPGPLPLEAVTARGAGMARLVRLLAAAIPSGRARRIDGAGHAAPFDAPEAFAQVIADAAGLVSRDDVGPIGLATLTR